jgi:hypothetical protein
MKFHFVLFGEKIGEKAHTFSPKISDYQINSVELLQHRKDLLLR